MKIDKNSEKVFYLSQEILELSKTDVLLHLRFLDTSIDKLVFMPFFVETIGTNGKEVIYNPDYILKCYKKESEVIPRTVLHIILHCIFKHIFVDSNINRELWNLACDIAVENIIDELDVRSLNDTQKESREICSQMLKESVGIMTAEKIYRYFQDSNLSSKEYKRLSKLFARDSHDLWYTDMKSSGGGNGEPNSSNPQKSSEDKPREFDNKKGSDESIGETEESEEISLFAGNAEDESEGIGGRGAEAEELWSGIAAQVKVDMETFSNQHDYDTGSLMQNLKAVTKEKYDYRSFLKRFSVLGEAMKINDDEFDYIYYTYGLKMYKKMPLVEPLEYKEVKSIREFVIAIDTSGSTSGELVQTFLNKTYNILKSTESFFTKINLHIIQCDADIQEDAKITSQEEFDEYIKTMKIKGLGGTDFRPVFEYVDKLVNNGELKKLKGLIYFTDGYGDFPEQKPDYNTAFVFIDDEYGNPEVPPWAIKLVLDNEDIKNIK